LTLLFSAAVVGLYSVREHKAHASVESATPTLEQRRAVLDARVAKADSLLARKAGEATSGQRVAQWPNWPNYWSNWPNWRNFR
jgi:hypothetical protein